MSSPLVGEATRARSVLVAGTVGPHLFRAALLVALVVAAIALVVVLLLMLLPQLLTLLGAALAVGALWRMLRRGADEP